MKKILLVLLCFMLVGCSSSDVNETPESVIKNYMKAIVNHDESLLKQCLDKDDKVSSLLDNDYNDFNMLKIQLLSDNQYVYTGLLNCGNDLTIPYINVCDVTQIKDLYYVVSSSLYEYSDKAITKLQEVRDSEVYQEYINQMQSFLSKENLEKLYKSVEDFKNSDQYEQYMSQLSEYMNSDAFKNAVNDIKNFTSSDTYKQLSENLNNFVKSDKFKSMQDELKNFLNSEEIQGLFDKIGDMFK